MEDKMIHLKEKQKEIDDFVNQIMEEIENKKIDLAYSEYLLNQLKNKIDFWLRIDKL